MKLLSTTLALLCTAPALLLTGAGTTSAQPAAGHPALSVRHFQNDRFQRCLDADINTGGNGGKVQLWDCGPWNQQQWILRGDGSVYNVRFQRCLDADINTGNHNGGVVQLWDCGPWNQQWWR
ncbi:RICIN domain-containing protein [Amycolatopsis minnesotensis]|uniref:Ricin B lectin domain-containing protein n=1 Tax=Amycolatopsis minnesotensis TaxID=337894 RepID=A0ABN2SMH2_9PSEU